MIPPRLVRMRELELEIPGQSGRDLVELEHGHVAAGAGVVAEAELTGGLALADPRMDGCTQGGLRVGMEAEEGSSPE